MQNEDLFIIVVLYNPSKQQVDRLIKLSANYHVIAVDNTCSDKMTYCLQKKGLEHIVLGENKGIAKAQNIGIERCKTLNAKYVLFLDQDTVIDMTFPKLLLNDYLFLSSSSSAVIAIGPEVYDKDTMSTYKSYENVNKREKKLICVPTLISSGTLMPIDAFTKVGLMEEKLFIDYVDHEWCWRASANGYKCYMDMNVRIAHKVGNNTISLCGFPFIVSSPFRYFYQYRNSLWLMRRCYVPFDWKMKTFFRNLIALFFIPWHSSAPWNIVKNMIKGILIGLRLDR